MKPWIVLLLVLVLPALACTVITVGGSTPTPALAPMLGYPTISQAATGAAHPALRTTDAPRPSTPAATPTPFNQPVIMLIPERTVKP